MRGVGPRTLLHSLLTLTFFVFAAEDSRASRCGDVYPGALQGPPPEWTFWGDGAACYVRWRTGQGGDQALLAKCRATPGVRFVHFEPDRGAGSICVFKLLDAAQDEEDVLQKSAEQREELRSTHYRKADAESPLLDRIQLLVTAWTERCLDEEKTNSYAIAARCWREGAAEVEALTSTNSGVLSVPMQNEISTLKQKWLDRAEQLKPYVVQAVKAPIENVNPRPRPERGRPDPRRLVETALCSSIRLGDYKRCIGEPVSTGPATYAFGLRVSCSRGAAAAIRTQDAAGRCVRRVVAIHPEEPRPEVKSHAEPAVLDAISYRDARTFECYARRHDYISCDGKIDYGAMAAIADEPAGDVELSEANANSKGRAGRRSKREPSLLRKLSRGFKNLIGSD